MAYSTVKMVRQALAPSSTGEQPVTPTNTAADLTDTQLLDAIAEADATIDGYVGRYYAVPVALIVADSDEDGPVGSIPHPIDYWSRNLAAYNATLTLRGSQDFTDEDPVARRYKATMDALKGVGNGTISLQLPDNRSINSSTGATSAFNPYVGDLFDPTDFALRPVSPSWPIGPSTWGRRWEEFP